MAEQDREQASLVVRHNRLIESRHKMTMAERRFILWNIAQINKEDTSFRPFEISVRDYFDVIGLRQISNPYEIVRKMHDRLTTGTSASNIRIQGARPLLHICPGFPNWNIVTGAYMPC